MKLLILAQEISRDQPGGSGRVVWEEARALAVAGHTVAVGVPRARAELKEEEKRDGVTIFRFGDVKRRATFGRSIADIIETPRFVKQMIAGGTWDALLIHHPHVAYGALRVNAARKIPLLYVFHASAAAEMQYEGLSRPGLWPVVTFFLKPIFVRWTRWIERRVLRQADSVGVFSEYSGKLLKELYGFVTRKKKIVRLPMGVDTKHFRIATSRDAVRRKLGFDNKTFLFVTVRRLVPRTGVRILLDAFRIAHDRLGGKAELAIIGEGRERETLTRYAAEIGIKDQVHFVGRVTDDELPLWYQAADACVVPTVMYEGFGVSIIEALACGTPVIGTPIGAIPEILLAFDERLLADAARPITIADRLVWFAEEGVHEDWKDHARRFVERFYSWEKHAEKVIESL